MAVRHVNLGHHGSFNIHEGGLHRALGIPSGHPIPESRVRSAEHSPNQHVRRMAASAEGLKHMHRSGGASGKPKRSKGYGGRVFEEK
jgi:hypothetical protein